MRSTTWSNLRSRSGPARWFRALFAWMVKGVRTACVFFVLLSAGTAWALALAEKNAERAAQEFGGTLLDALSTGFSETDKGSLGTSPPTVLTVNGMTVRVQTGSIKANQMSLAHFLRRVERECAQGPSSATVARTQQGMAVPAPLMHADNETDGFVACLKPAFRMTLDRLAEWARESAGTGDLSSLGIYRGVYVRKEGDLLTAVSAEILDGLRLAEMFPGQGDAPGFDMPDLPRPQGRRTLSVAHRQSIGLAAYASPLEPTEAVASYLKTLPDHVVVRDPKEGTKNSRSAALIQTAEDSFVLSASEAPQGNTLIIARLPR